MQGKHFYQCAACGNLYASEEAPGDAFEYAFDDALNCCSPELSVKELWKCALCGKTHNSKTARRDAANCCFEDVLCDCRLGPKAKSKTECQECRALAAKTEELRKKFGTSDYFSVPLEPGDPVFGLSDCKNKIKIRAISVAGKVAVISKTGDKVESYWNSREEAENHITRFGMQTDFTVGTETAGG